MSVTAKNAPLSQAEMEGNAAYVAAFLSGKGWTVNAIAATLANMQAESGINPGAYESYNANSDSNGFGLVQWTPNTKYKEWADANGYGANYSDIGGQLARIHYEMENGLQWIQTDAYPLTFAEYSQSTAEVGGLAYAFMYNYERPASLDQPARKEYAENWLSFLKGAGIEPEPEPEKPKRKQMSRLLFLWAATRR